MLQRALLTLFLILAAIGLGLYVYPAHPYVVWGLLFFCWLCYRLKMRADRLFSKRDQLKTSEDQ